MADMAALDVKKISLVTEPSEYLSYDLRYDGESIGDQVINGQKALYDGDYELLGKLMGEIFQLAEKDESKLDLSNLAEMVQGFLSKLGVDMDFMGLLLCIYEADQSAIMLYEDIQMAEEAWKDKDIMEGIFVGVLTLAFVQSLQQQVEPACANAFHHKDWKNFNKMLAFGDKPMFAAQNYLGVNVEDHATKAGELYMAEDWFNYGAEVANVLNQMDLSQTDALY